MEYIKDENGRIWRKNGTAIKKNKASIIEAYNNGKCEKVMRLELPVKTCIAVLNGLYESGNFMRRFYKDLGPVFGNGYVFSSSDLLSESFQNKVRYMFFTDQGDKKEIKCLCLASVVVCILSKALADNRIRQAYYNVVLKKYHKYNFSHLSPEKRIKEKERIKRKMEREQARKEWEMRPQIIYTPMGNDKRRKYTKQ